MAYFLPFVNIPKDLNPRTFGLHGLITCNKYTNNLNDDDNANDKSSRALNQLLNNVVHVLMMKDEIPTTLLRFSRATKRFF